MNAAAINSLSASGSSNMPIVVIWPRFRARYPSMPSVIDAAIKMADARISCSPFKPANRLLERIQISSGMQQMRVSVMELGRFTRQNRARGSPPVRLCSCEFDQATKSSRAMRNLYCRIRALSHPGLLPSSCRSKMPTKKNVSIMNSERTLLSSILFLALGLGLILGFCHGSTIGFGAAYPVSGTSLQVVVNTTGLPAMAGFASTLIGILLLILATILAIVGQVRWPGEKTSLSRVRE